MPSQKGLGSEHPHCDTAQIVFILNFLTIWGFDSFFIQFSTVFTKSIHVYIRLFLGALICLLGVSFTQRAHDAIFDKRIQTPQLITSGVYAWVRHPMYFGILFIGLGLVISTLSLLSLLVRFGLFQFYNIMATYEEQNLFQVLGNQYYLYQQQVPKWFLPMGSWRQSDNRGQR
jgi:protein-S-isoprenylcysteine O-methyltransferase Ste14